MNTIISLRKIRNYGITGHMATAFLCLTGFGMSAQTVISGGTTMKISQGTAVHSRENFAVKGNGSLNNKGTVILEKNLVNQNTGANSVGSGLFIF